jgi:hypothetical protein
MRVNRDFIFVCERGRGRERHGEVVGVSQRVARSLLRVEFKESGSGRETIAES